MKKRLISAIMIMAMLTVNMFSVAADSTTVSELIGALPEASEITASTKELRSQIEDINEAIIENGLTESDFSESVWKKWQSVSAKNAYFLPKYETIDISSAAKSVVFANVGETLTNESDFRMNITTWNWYYAFNKETMTKTIGADELLYSDDGIPYSFPQDYRKAIGQDNQGLVDIVLPINEPKAYRSIAMAMTAVGSNPEAAIRFHYTDGSMEEQRVTVNSCYATDGTLTAASADWPMIQASGGNALDVAYAKLGMNSIEFPTDINRKLSKIEIIDYEDPDKTLADGSVDYSPRDLNFRVLAITGCTDISDAEKDNRENKYETVDITEAGNSVVYVDGDNVALSDLSLTSLDLIDWSQLNGYKIALSKDAMTEAVGDDEKIYSREGVVYSFPADNYKAIAVKKGEADSVFVNIGKKAYGINILALTGQYSGHGNAEGALRVYYKDGTHTDKYFTVLDGWGIGESTVKNMVFAPKILHGNVTLNSDGSPLSNHFAAFETSLETDGNREIEKIEFKSVNNTSNFKVLGVTLTTDISAAEKNEAAYKKTTPVYVDIESIGNGKFFTDETNLSKAGLTRHDYISFDYNNRSIIAVDKEAMNNMSTADGVIYAEDGTPYCIPANQYKALTVEYGYNPVEIDVVDGKYENVSFAIGTTDATGENAAQIVIKYTDNTSDIISVTPQSGYGGAAVKNAVGYPRSFMSWDANPFYYEVQAPAFSLASYTVAANPNKTISSLVISCNGEYTTYHVPAITLGKASLYTTAHSADKIALSEAAINKTVIEEAYEAASTAVENGWDSWASFKNLVALKSEISKGYKVSADVLAMDNGDGTANITVILSTTETEEVSGDLYIAVYNASSNKLVNVYKENFAITSDGDVKNFDVAYSSDYVLKSYMLSSALAPLGSVGTISVE